MAQLAYRCFGHSLGVARRLVQSYLRLAAPTARAEGSRGHLMGRLRHGLPAAVLLSLASVCASCGTTSSSTPPPPSAADFTLGLSSNSISITQGAASSALNVAVNPLNGFSGAVQVTLNTLPSGVTSNPVSPFTVAAGASTSVVFGASASAATGNFTISVHGTSGALSHSASLAVAILSAVNPPLPRTAFERTDSTSASDDPFGEPHHRHIAYDPANKHVFVANRAMNRVDIFSSASQSPIAQVSVPGASSADLSADGSTVWIGTALERIVAIDTSSLRIRNRYSLAGLTPIPGTIFSRPVEVLSFSNGKAMVRLRQPVSSEALLALWDPASNSLTDLTSTAPALFQHGVGVLARSGDHSKLLAAANDSSGELALFDSGGNVVAGPITFGPGLIPMIAANSDGSRFAAIFNANGNTQLLLLDASLKQVGVYVPAIAHGIAFSRDGKYLYLSESSSGASFVTVLDGQSAQVIGRVPDVAIQGVSSEIEDADETQLLFGVSNRGVSFVDAATPSNLPSTAPAIAAAPSLQPSEGPVTGGTSVVLAGQNFTSTSQVKFGSQSALNVTVSGPTQIQASSPPSVASGAVNVASYFQNGWLAIAPDAFSYGPQILQLLPNAGASTGGDSVQIYGYGFGSDATKITVKIGGANATVQKVENVTSIASSISLDASYPFSLERIALQTPPGSSGKADVLISTPAGSTTSAKSFQFLQSVQSYAKSGFYKFLLYDQKRQRLYLTNVDHVDIFDLQQNIYLAPLQPPGGPPPAAGLRGLALTPDASQLIVADFGAQNVYLLDPVSGTGTTVPVGGVPGFTNSGPARVAATSTQAEPHRRASRSGHGRRRSRFCGLRRGSRWSRRCVECECPESVPHFCCQRLHKRSGRFLRRQHVCLPVKSHDRNSRRGSFPHFRSHRGGTPANPGASARARPCSASIRRIDLSAFPNRRFRERRRKRRHRHSRRALGSAPFTNLSPSAVHDRHRRPSWQLPRHGRKWSAPLRHHFLGWHTPKRRLDRCSARRRPVGNWHHYTFHRCRNRWRHAHHPRQRLPERHHRHHQRKSRQRHIQRCQHSSHRNPQLHPRPPADHHH